MNLTPTWCAAHPSVWLDTNGACALCVSVHGLPRVYDHLPDDLLLVAQKLISQTQDLVSERDAELSRLRGGVLDALVRCELGDSTGEIATRLRAVLSHRSESETP